MKDETLSQSFPEAFTMIFFDHSNFPFRFVDKDWMTKSGSDFIRLPTHSCIDEYGELYPKPNKTEDYRERNLPLYINYKCVALDHQTWSYYDPL
jgi:hypothetical protein